MSCADVQTIQPGNGVKTQFSFDFPYIFKSEIQVSFWNVTTKEWDVIAQGNATYPWQLTDANPTIIEFTSTAPPAPAVPVNPGETSVDNVRIRRVTNIDAIRALFNPGSAIRSDDLNKNFEQLRYAIQETNCQEVPQELYDFLKDYYWDNFDETVYSTDTWDSSDAKIATTAAVDGETQIKFDTIVQTTTPSGTGWRIGKTWLQNDEELTLSIWNGSTWLGVASGGTFINQPKVVYVDASAGNDGNDGHRISRPKKTIKAAINQINSDTSFGDGSIVVVAPGVYQEEAPIDIQRPNVSIVGTSLRSCIVHPTVATETNVLFRVNSGSYLQNLTFMGMKASGAAGNAVDPELPGQQGWNVAFYPGATIRKSPYIQNCTNFSDSGIDNSNINVINPGGGSGGDLTSSPTGGGLLVDGSVVNTASPLRSMVCDSYTHVGLNGPGILITNNGYAQCTSSYAFFNTYHIKCRNGGQANLAASTTDFGDRALVADGKSTFAIFTADLSTNANDGDITFTIDEPVANVAWHGSATRPQGNMLVILNGITYPILSATANGTGWDVTISRPNPTNRSENLGLNGAVTTPATAAFYLRSMIASSGHTMEYVGSGTDYRALPENGGVPDDTKQITELNGGKIWTATTDQNGKFKVGDFFEVDQQTGFVTIPSGSIAFDLASDLSPQLGANLDVLDKSISSSTGNVVVADTLDVNSNNIINVTDPINAQDAATKNYVDNFAIVTDTTPQLGGDLDANGNSIILDTGTAADPSLTFTGDPNTGIYSPGADQVAVATNGVGRLFVDASGRVGVGSASTGSTFRSTGLTGASIIEAFGADTDGFADLEIKSNGASGASRLYFSDTAAQSGLIRYSHNTDSLEFATAGAEGARIDSSGRLLIGTSIPTVSKLFVAGGSLSVSGSDTDFSSGGNRAVVDVAGAVARIGAVSGGGSAIGLDFIVGTTREAGINASGIFDAKATESKATNGYVKLPSGIYIQWGINQSTTGGSTHSFPIAFPTAAWVITGTHNNQNNPASSQCTILSASQFSLTTSAGTPSLNWIAIGH